MNLSVVLARENENSKQFHMTVDILSSLTQLHEFRVPSLMQKLKVEEKW